MKPFMKCTNTRALILAFILLPLALCACSSSVVAVTSSNQGQVGDWGYDTSRYFSAVEDEPDTVDFQCTSIHYTIATNVFNRLVEMESATDGRVMVMPSLAKSWEVSADGRTYTFHLREGVKFSNGSPLTSSDVLYTMTRLLTHPDSCNQDIAEMIVGADELMQGKADHLEGFKALSDSDFTITLQQPFEAFLACLSMPGASIMDEETMKSAGDGFGKDPACTIGTGSFILKEWVPGKGMLLTANEGCWQGAPHCEGLDLRFITEPEEIREMFDDGELDIIDLDDVGDLADYYVHGDIYQNRLYQVPRIAITYTALNEKSGPLSDANVRKALQMALDRKLLLDVIYSGRGSVEQGIYPHGLYGFNENLEAIPYDTEEAKILLREAGYPDGFDLVYSVRSSSAQREMDMARLIVSMWNDIGVRATIEVLNEDEFMSRRKSGGLACYSATWTADYNDPDNFIYTFFGNRENTIFRSLCYQREDIMNRVRLARTITDPEKRIQEYQDLERIIAQKDAAWIPLLSRMYLYVTSERVESIRHSWNGSVKNEYRNVVLKKTA